MTRPAFLLSTSLLVLSALVVAPSRAAEPVNIPQGERGELPVNDDGKPLNLDFETGTLQDWTAAGEAFQGQPIKGPIDPRRPSGADKVSDHTGQFWIGGFEKLQDAPVGTLTSATFKVTHPFASFLIGGGSQNETRVEIVRAEDGKVQFVASGVNAENMRPVVIDLKELQGQKIFIRIVDAHRGGWGHVNFDDFRFHTKRPEFAAPATLTQPLPDVAKIYPLAGVDGQTAAQAMQLPDGFSVQVGAAEPDVRQPIAMAIDDRGRVWIAEAYEYPRRAAEGQGHDRVLIFEDTDGDGTLDRRTVFYEGLNLVSGLEVGFGGVWIGAAPYLQFIPDRNGDDQPDGPPEVLLDGWGYQDTHETLNTFIWGPDGWLYGCHGVFTYSRVGKPGTPDDQRVPLNAGIWRYHPTRHEFEVFAHGTSNPWGVDFNDYGQAFLTSCVIPHLYHVIQGARYERQGGQHFNPYTYDDIKTIADHRHFRGNQWNNNDRTSSDDLGGGHAHAGAMIYLGGSWPERYRNQIFMNNIHGNRLNQDLLKPEGSGYVGSHGPDFLLTGDQWSQILNLRYGPDGQAWMIDWYDANQCHRNEPEAHNRSNGRIYRVVYNNVQPVTVDLTKLSDAELVELQLHDNDWYVRHARRLLAERAAAGAIDAAARARLTELALTHPDETRRLRALWALHVTGGLDEAISARLLVDASPYVRAWTMQLNLERAATGISDAFVAKLAELAHGDPSPVVRLYLASGLQRLPAEQRWDILAGLVTHGEDATDHNLPLMYWYAAEPLADVDMRRALALSLIGGQKIPLLNQFMVRRIGSNNAGKALELLVEGLGETRDAATRLTFLRGIREALRGKRQVDPPASWAKVYETLRGDGQQDVRLEAAVLAATFGDASAKGELKQQAADAIVAVSQRQLALATLLKTGADDLAGYLQNLATNEGPLRSDALRGLATLDDSRTPPIVLNVYETLSPAERRDALATLCARPQYALALLDAISEKKIPASHLSADLVRQLRNLGDEKLNARIADVWGTVRETAADRAELITKYKQLVGDGHGERPDVELGRALFAKTCQQCHTLFGVGGKVGPDLTGSNRANLDYLLSNVIDPSAVLAKEYQPSVIQTADGRVITGIIRESDATSLVVQTANETLVVPRDEIDELKLSDKSMMPDDLLRQLTDDQARALVAYLASPVQTPMSATAENAPGLFNGTDLTGWRGDEKLWSVENGEIVGRSPGLSANEFLLSDLAVEDFELSLEVKLVPNEGNSGVQFRSQVLPSGDVQGYQADIGAGWWGKLYEEHGRGLLWDKSGEEHLKPGQWNEYKIEVIGSRIRTYLNGQLCVDLDDPQGARRGILALQIHSGGPFEVRFRNIQLKVASH